MSKVYAATNKIHTKLLDCEGCEGGEGSWRDNMVDLSAKSTSETRDYDEIDANIDINIKNSEKIKPEINDIFNKELWPDLVSASHASHASHEYPPDCYYCDEKFNGIGKEGYENHVLKKHQEKPCYPGLADLEVYQIEPKGMEWE